MRRLGRILVGAFFVLGVVSSLSSCGGGESEDQKVAVTLLPDAPIVFKPDRLIPDGQGGFTQIKGPWFSFRLKLKNGADKIVTIVAMSVTVFGDGIKEVSAAFDGMDLDPPEEYLIQLAPAGQAGAEFVSPITFYIGSLPVSEDDFFRFRSKIELLGWYGDENNPEKRFRRSMFFSTQ